MARAAGGANGVKRLDRETSVFSTSAVDLFASALGAFILLVMLLFPFYRHAGPTSQPSDTSELIQKRRQAVRAAAESLAKTRTTEALVAEWEARAETLRQQMVSVQEELFSLAQKRVEEPPDVEPEKPEPQRAIPDGVAFSLLGIATDKTDFLVLIDLSGSMTAYNDLMIQSVLEILSPLGPRNRFAILGYSGMGSTRLTGYPGGTRLVQATPGNLRAAEAFTRSLRSRFGGSTPTHRALLNALRFPVEAIILISDGAPDSDPDRIIADITSLNRREGKEIHTVALGNYTSDRDLVEFLQGLARSNSGDFVGVSR